MRVKDILAHKGAEVHTIELDATLLHFAQKITQLQIGILVCTDSSGSLIGIISERDLARSIAKHGAAALDMPVSTAMSRDVFACGLEDMTDPLMTVMTETRCRHLPVINEGRLVGLVSIGDLVKARNRREMTDAA